MFVCCIFITVFWETASVCIRSGSPALKPYARLFLPVSSFEKTMKIWLIGLPFYLWICYNNNIEQRQFLPKKSTKCFAIAKEYSLCGKSIDVVDSAANASLRTEKFFKSHAMRFRQGNFVPNIGNKEVLHRCIASVWMQFLLSLMFLLFDVPWNS